MSRVTSRRRPMLAATALLASSAFLLAACSNGNAAAGQSGGEKLVIAEPAHNLGYLPLYVAIDEGFFEDEGVEVETVTLQGGGAHTNAVLTGEAWAFIGGPEHNAFAAARDNSVVVKAVTNVVNRGNVYLVAPPDVEYHGDLASFLDGKTIATGAAGGTPNSITLYLLQEAGLVNGEDVTLVESADANAAVAIMKQEQADVAVVAEPVLGAGIAEGVWGEPFLSIPQELGPYAYSTINVREDSLSDTETVEGFIRGLRRGLDLIEREPDAALEIAQNEFPTLAPGVVEETVQRAVDDEIWEWSGDISPEAVDTALDVVRAAGILEDDSDTVQYDDIVDMSFWDEASAE